MPGVEGYKHVCERAAQGKPLSLGEPDSMETLELQPRISTNLCEIKVRYPGLLLLNEEGPTTKA